MGTQLVPRIALHMLPAAYAHTSPPLEPPVSYRNSSCDEDSPKKNLDDETCGNNDDSRDDHDDNFTTPKRETNGHQGETSLSTLTPWNSSSLWPLRGGSEVRGDGRREKSEGVVTRELLVKRLVSMGCEKKLMDACESMHDLEALYDILSGKFDSRATLCSSAQLEADRGGGPHTRMWGGEGGSSSTEEAAAQRTRAGGKEGIYGATVFRAEEGESMAHVYIYSARHVPLFANESVHASTSPISAAATYCTVSCGKHVARTSLACGARGGIFNERFDMGLNLRHQHAQISISLYRHHRSTGAGADDSATSAGGAEEERNELIGQVRLKTSTILASISSPTAAATATSRDTREAAAAAGCTATCEGWYDVCLHGRSVVGVEGVAGLHIRVTLSGIPAVCLASGHKGGEVQEIQRRERKHDARAFKPELVLVPQLRKDARHKDTSASVKDSAKQEDDAHRHIAKLLASLPSTRAAAAAAAAGAGGKRGGGEEAVSQDTTRMLQSLQAENQRLAQELSSLRRQQQPQHTTDASRSLSRSPASSTDDSTTKSEASSAICSTLASSSSSTSSDATRRAALDREVVLRIQEWGNALHKIRPKIGPNDALYSTIEWLVQVCVS